MTDIINKKVIDIFAKHKKNAVVCKDDKVCTTEEGYYYVCLKADLNGKHFDEKKLVKNANECYYIVKIMIKESISPYIYSYKVPGENILDFLKLYINGEKEGQVIEIDKFYKDEWA